MSQGLGGGAQITILFDNLFGESTGSSSGRESGGGSGDGSGRDSGNRFRDGSTKAKSRSSESPIKSKSNSPGQFQEDTQDGVNQDYFKPVSPSRDSYVQPIEETTPSVSEQEQQDQRELKKQMNELDYTIKLKKVKKKKKK